MKIQSERAKEIDAYLNTHLDAEVGRWPLEISSVKKILPFYRFPIKPLLRYNINNGRFAMEVQEWETKNKRKLDSCRDDDAEIIRNLLSELSREQTELLKKDLKSKGQMEPGVITYDGFEINGNRRMAILEELWMEEKIGKYECFEAIRLPASIGARDLWRIEAGLQLSQDKVAEYHPVNELLKIKQGCDAGLDVGEISASMYGRSEDYVRECLSRLELIDTFLDSIKQPQNYGFIKKFGLHEYFIDVQNSVLKKLKKDGVNKRQISEYLNYSFALIHAGVLIQKEAKKKREGITHWDIRKLGKIFSNAHAKDAFLENIRKEKRILDVNSKTLVEDFKAATEILDMQEQSDQPIKLVEKATKALESIDRTNRHFREERVIKAMNKLALLVNEIKKELSH